MSKIQQKLTENKSKIRREKILSASDQVLSDFLSRAEYSNEVSCIKNAVFPRWKKNINEIKTSRDVISNWNNITFKTWQELINVLKRFKRVKNYIGWFFIDREGPYFKISLNAFLSHIQNISSYGEQNEHYNYGWVGEFDNVGIIIETTTISSSNKKFNIIIWGM